MWWRRPGWPGLCLVHNGDISADFIYKHSSKLGWRGAAPHPSKLFQILPLSCKFQPTPSWYAILELTWIISNAFPVGRIVLLGSEAASLAQEPIRARILHQHWLEFSNAVSPHPFFSPLHSQSPILLQYSPTHPHIRMSTCPPTHAFAIHPYTHPFIHAPIYLPHPSFSSSHHPFIPHSHPPFHPSISTSIHLSIFYILAFIYSLHTFILPSILSYLFIHHPFMYLPVHPCIHNPSH